MKIEDIETVPVESGFGAFFCNWKAWVEKENEDTLIIQCAGRGLVSYILLFVIFTGCSALFYHLFPDHLKIFILWLIYPFLLVMYGVIGICEYFYARQGDWLVYDKRSNRICLPRINVSFDKDHLVLFQVIYGSFESCGESGDAQINVVVKDAEQYKRYPLMTSQAKRWILPLIESVANKLKCQLHMVEYYSGKIIVNTITGSNKTAFQ